MAIHKINAKIILYLTAFLFLIGAPPASPSALKDDETLILYKTQGYRSMGGDEWIIPIHCWVGELEEDSLLRAALITSIEEVVGEGWSASERQLFEERIRPFRADDELVKEVSVEVGGVSTSLGPSSPDGHIFGEAKLTVKSAGSAAILTASSEGAKATVSLIPAYGVSVISDIDDTIKISNVSNKPELMKNTFFRPFSAVDGMSALYQGWKREGASFHYLSGSPWQLYQALDDFINDNDFPVGAFYLKTIRFNPLHIAKLFDDPEDFKLREIKKLFERYPLRKFILVGDSGEMDPEIYGEAARLYPDMVIFIRDVTGEGREAKRFLEAFKGVSSSRWELFKVGHELLNKDIIY